MTRRKLYSTELNRDETLEIIDLLRLRRNFAGISLKDLTAGVDEFIEWHKLRDQHLRRASYSDAKSTFRTRYRAQRIHNRAARSSGAARSKSRQCHALPPWQACR